MTCSSTTTALVWGRPRAAEAPDLSYAERALWMTAADEAQRLASLGTPGGGLPPSSTTTDADSSLDDNVREDFESCYPACFGAPRADFVHQHNVDLPLRVQVLLDTV